MHAAASRRPVLIIALCCIALLLHGCGFAPRGETLRLAGVPSPTFISGIAAHTPLHRELGYRLQAAGKTLASARSEAAAVLRLDELRSESRLLSVDSRNRAVEYELEESVRFGLFASDGTRLLEEQTVRVLRIQYQPQEALLASTREAELQRADMRRELADRIVRRLAAL